MTKAIDQILQSICGKLFSTDSEDARTFIGSGYLIGSDSFVTCEHVIQGVTKIEIEISGAIRMANVACTDPAADVAILHLAEPIENPDIQEITSECQFDATWWSYGYGDAAGGAGVVVKGRISATSVRSPNNRVSIQLSCEAMDSNTDPRGFSGSPVFSNGQIIGHISEYAPGTGSNASELKILWAAPGGAILLLKKPLEVSRSRGLLHLVDEIRGSSPDSVVLAIFDLSVQQLGMVTELRQAVEGADDIDLRYHYVGPAAAKEWIDLSSDAKYGRLTVVSQLQELQDELVREVRDCLKSTQIGGGTVSLVSLGCGDGVIDRTLLELMHYARLPVEAYIPVDLSTDLLQTAVAKVRNSPPLASISVLPVCADLLDLGKVGHVWPNTPNVEIYSLLGYTFGNFEDEGALVAQILKSLGPEDLVMIDARCYATSFKDFKDPIGKTLRGQIVERYAHEQNDKFAFGPLTWLTTRAPQPADFDHHVSFRANERVPGTVSAYTRLTLSDSWRKELGIKAKNRKFITLAWSSIYREKDLEDWLKAEGRFDIAVKKCFRETDFLTTNVYVLRRQPEPV